MALPENRPEATSRETNREVPTEREVGVARGVGQLVERSQRNSNVAVRLPNECMTEMLGQGAGAPEGFLGCALTAPRRLEQDGL